MSATSARAAIHDRRPKKIEPTAYRGASAFDVEKTQGPFRADIAQLAHTLKRLLASGHRSKRQAIQSPPANAPASTCILGDFEQVM